MADVMDDGEFWLPSQFLSGDDWFLEKDYMTTVTNGNTNSQKGFFTKDAFGVPYNFPADLISTLESASPESEEDDYAFLAGVTHQMAHSTLHASDLSSVSHGWPSKPVSRSPQSALCHVGTGCGCRRTTTGIPYSKVCAASPQATWEQLYDAAAAKMKVDEDTVTYGSHVSNGGLLLDPTRNHFALNLDHKRAPSTADVALYHKLQALRFQRLRQQQLLKRLQQQQGVAWGGAHLHHKHPSREGASLFTGLASSPFSRPHQQLKHSGSAAQPVFLGNLPSKKERTGTGVFLPRRRAAPAGDALKTVCSTVLLPARVAQDVNLNQHDPRGTEQLHPMFPGDNAVYYPASKSVPRVDARDMRLRSGDYLGESHGKHGFRSQQPVISSEVSLPQEWTY